MESSLVQRARVCGDGELCARVAQALLEAGKKPALLVASVAGIVAESRQVGVGSEVDAKALGSVISDDEIIAFVAGLV